MKYIFTDHAERRFNKRFGKHIKSDVVKSLKSLAKLKIPEIINSESYMKNKNKNKLHFFSSKEGIFFICEKKIQHNNEYAMVVITVFDDSFYGEEECLKERMLAFYKKQQNSLKNNKIIKNVKKIQCEETIQKNKKKNIQSFFNKYFKSKESFVHIEQKNIFNNNFEVDKTVLNLYFEIHKIVKKSVYKINSKNPEIQQISLLTAIRDIQKIKSKSELINEYDMANFNCFYNNVLNSFNSNLVNIIINLAKNNEPLIFLYWDYILKDCSDNELFLENKCLLIDFYIKNEIKNKKNLQSSDILFIRDLNMAVERLTKTLRSTVGNNNTYNKINEILNFYSPFLTFMSKNELKSFKLNN